MYGRRRRVAMLPTYRRLNTCLTSTRQGVVSVVKLYLLGAMLTSRRGNCCPPSTTSRERRIDATLGLARVDRSTYEQVGSDRITPERLTVNRSAATQLATTNRGCSARPTLKLGTYKRTTPLETFLAKFENSSGYYVWDAMRESAFVICGHV